MSDPLLENEYAPTTADVAPVIVTTMFPVPLGFLRYQNSASLLEKEDTFLVSDTPPNVIDATLLLLADYTNYKEVVTASACIEIRNVI